MFVKAGKQHFAAFIECSINEINHHCRFFTDQHLSNGQGSSGEIAMPADQNRAASPGTDLCSRLFGFLFLGDHYKGSDDSRHPSEYGKQAGEHDCAGFFVHDGGRRHDDCQDQAANVHSYLQVRGCSVSTLNLVFESTTINGKPAGSCCVDIQA
jgi:hypothetical protein